MEYLHVMKWNFFDCCKQNPKVQFLGLILPAEKSDHYRMQGPAEISNALICLSSNFFLSDKRIKKFQWNSLLFVIKSMSKWPTY